MSRKSNDVQAGTRVRMTDAARVQFPDVPGVGVVVARGRQPGTRSLIQVRQEGLPGARWWALKYWEVAPDADASVLSGTDRTASQSVPILPSGETLK